MKYVLSSLVFFVAAVITCFVYILCIKPAIFHKAALFQHPQTASVGDASLSHSLVPLASNQWYSSVYTSLPTAPLYALPLAVKFDNEGIGISYPSVTAKANEIDAPFSQDIKLTASDAVQKIQVKQIGDWHIQTELTDINGGVIDATLGHGLPFTTITTTEKQLALKVSGSFTIKNSNESIISKNASEFQSSNFLLSMDNASYIIAFPQKETVSIDGKTLFFPHIQHLFIGLLDDGNHYSDFVSLANTDVTDTEAYPSLQGNTAQTRYLVQTKNDITPLLALYPHQYENLQSPVKTLGSYQTIRGTLHLVKTNSFTTTNTLITPPSTFPSLITDHSDLKKQIRQDIASFIQKGPPDSKDYYLGTWFGKVSNLLLLANMENMDAEKKQLLIYIKPLFMRSLSYFSYDKNKTSLIAKSPEFGNEQLNDHHFHYGYYIRLGAIIGSFDPASVEEIKKGIAPMVADIATTTRTDNAYPFLRNFDIYESHSWADGYGNSEWGNNQESSSEAINAWYGLYLWSQVTHDTTLAQYSLYLYNGEITGAKYYWFDIDNMYTSPYKHAIASRVFGGKVDFDTWFSDETNMKYGIQLLPFSPASDYLDTFQNFENYQKDFTASGGGISKDWGDLFLMWESYYDPKDALSSKEDVNKLEGDNTKSMLLYELYRNQETNHTKSL